MGFKEFKEKCTNDEEFAKKYEDVESVEALVELAAKDGYNFTVDEYNAGSEISL